MVVLQSELDRIQVMQKAERIDEEKILSIMRTQKDLLSLPQLEDKKQVIMEYVDLDIVLPGSDKDDIEIDLKVRLFNGGGDPYQFTTTTSTRVLLKLSLCLAIVKSPTEAN